MSDEQNQGPHQAEKEQAAQQVSVINLVSKMTEIDFLPFGGKLPRIFGKTNFEGHDLNAMIDMVESAKPEDLETAATALLNAQTAIEDAAGELEGHISRVDWEGESGEAFRKWGAKLVIHARKLADFAEAAGTQMTASATGLASVRNAMPPRDTRQDPKTVADIPTPKRVDGNEEYAAALKAEQDRQEAINQMNRLASFYEVSETTLAQQEPPVFEAMPDVGVPKPQDYGTPIRPGAEVQGAGGLGAARESAVAGQESSGTASGQSRFGDTTPSLKDVDGSAVSSDGAVGTEIDSVGTLQPPQEAARSTPNSAQPITSSGSSSGGAPLPFASGPASLARGGQSGRTSGFGGTTGNRSPISAQGRAGAPGGTVGGRGATGPISAQGRTGTPGGAVGGRGVTGPISAQGRAGAPGGVAGGGGAGPMGRAAATGPSGVRAGGTAAGNSPVGRGISGGTPRPIGGTVSGRAGGMGPTGAVHGNGVVGGRPISGAAPGVTSSRVPRGTVVGAEGSSGSRSPVGKIEQRGVIGAPQSAPGARPAQAVRPASGNPDGVVGTPKGRVRAGRNGVSASGGAGVPQGLRPNRRNTNREDRQDQRQPETQRRNAPPATD
ncbi:WXG100 family type VII secretion target [Streptomyces sp. NBC_00286]|uniref:WXG100 family type VII secretion target n=1 Tax=Streptomyces sp. NBC_00286 TaxID=2975701 RepID=UPI002E2D9B43|nr:WXG100 family type VII secretion target [Streptomyces sp. NBC_00286]